ncbi:MAG: radical SAM protein [Lentisphaerae bacterium]|nr:radical SAM protein [Lentisphaerota bacterium]
MIAIPWNRQTVPHCVLEITQQCNLSCKACYREKMSHTRSVGQVLADLETIEKNQDVQTVSLAGGEPTLHPDLVEIVDRVHQRGHRVSLVTNGLLLTDDLLARLKTAGLDIVMLHVDEEQSRPDLPENPTIEAINALRKKLSEQVARHGIDAGLCVTIYKEHFGHLQHLIDCITSTPDINFVFATHAAEIPDIVEHSNISAAAPNGGIYRSAPTRNSDVQDFFRSTYGIDCFAYIPPKKPDSNEWPCISYYLPVLHSKTGNKLYTVQSGKADQALIRLSRKLTGRYMYYCPPRRWIIALQLLINGASTGSFFRAFGFVLQSLAPGKRLSAKRLVFENAPVVMEDGTVNCCDFCPNSTARNGKVIPVCLADHLEPIV